jgi:folate-dependent phosphoribosylglycinamide formyltransferase PurN
VKTLLLCNPAPNQRALANKLHAVSPLTAIALVTPAAAKARTKLSRRLAGALLGLPLRRAWFAMLASYARRFPEFPEVPLSRHEGVNSDSVCRLVEEVRPDLVLVSGTDLLRPPLIELVSRFGRIMNLHTGISPYVKGGPNCTNWCLALAEPDLIGNTIMWIDAGIDSGQIVATERTALSGTESLTALHVAVMEHAHDLYSRALERARDGLALPSVPQRELGEGRLFLTRHWTPRQAARAYLNFRKNILRKVSPRPLRLVPLD